MIEPYELFVVGTHSSVLYFDKNMNLYKADGTPVSDGLKEAILKRPEIIKKVGA